MSDSSSSDDLPLSRLNHQTVVKNRAEDVVQMSDKGKGTRKKMRRASCHDSGSDGEISAMKRKKMKSAGNLRSGHNESAGNKKASKLKELTRVQRVEQGIAAFEWWNSPDPPEGKAWQTLEHCGMTFEPQYKPHGIAMVYDGVPISLTPYQEELATFYAAMPEDGPQLNV
jgi:DNA topoisomerase-1